MRKIETYKKGGSTKKKKDSKLTRAGVSGYNKPKRTPNILKNHMLLLLKLEIKLN